MVEAGKDLDAVEVLVQEHDVAAGAVGLEIKQKKVGLIYSQLGDLNEIKSDRYC